MSRQFRRCAGVAAFFTVASLLSAADHSIAQGSTPKIVARLVDEVRAASYPALQNSRFRYERLDSDFDFLQTRFTGGSFVSSTSLEYVIMVNPKLVERNAPSAGLRAILAHELAHAEYFQTHSRFELLGLVRLLSPSFAARFERSADLMAIGRGYGPGLKQYRVWLYPQIPQGRVREKKRDYFTPEEIDAIDDARSRISGVMDRLSRCVPLTMQELKAALANAGSCPGVGEVNR